MPKRDTGERTPVRPLKRAIQKITRREAPGDPATVELDGEQLRALWGIADAPQDNGGSEHRQDRRIEYASITVGEAFGEGKVQEVVRRGCEIEFLTGGDLETLSREAFVSVATLRRWSRGEAPHPTDAERQSICDTLGVTPGGGVAEPGRRAAAERQARHPNPAGAGRATAATPDHAPGHGRSPRTGPRGARSWRRCQDRGAGAQAEAGRGPPGR